MVLRKTCIPAKRSSVPYFRKTYVQSCLLERRGATRCFEVDRWCLLFFFFSFSQARINIVKHLVNMDIKAVTRINSLKKEMRF